MEESQLERRPARVGHSACKTWRLAQAGSRKWSKIVGWAEDFPYSNCILCMLLKYYLRDGCWRKLKQSSRIMRAAAALGGIAESDACTVHIPPRTFSRGTLLPWMPLLRLLRRLG